MADSEREDVVGFTDVRRVQGQVAPVISAPANYVDLNTMRTTLNTANSAFYTTARLNQMTKNDMVYAMRLLNDAAGIK